MPTPRPAPEGWRATWGTMNHERSRPEARLALARRLTEAAPGWAIWKNVESALAGRGDIDSVAPVADQTALKREFRSWAEANAMGPVLHCAHLPGSLLLVAVGADAHLEELQLCHRAVFRGNALFRAEDLTHLLQVDERGFRRLRPGSEGLFLLLHNGMTHGGRKAPKSLEAKGITELLRNDPEGVEGAASLLGWAARPSLNAARAVLDGRWDRPALLQVESWALARSLTDPRLLATRTAFRLAGHRYCKVLFALQRGRRVVGDVDRFLEEAGRNHPVFTST